MEERSSEGYRSTHCRMSGFPFRESFTFVYVRPIEKRPVALRWRLDHRHIVLAVVSCRAIIVVNHLHVLHADLVGIISRIDFFAITTTDPSTRMALTRNLMTPNLMLIQRPLLSVSTGKFQMKMTKVEIYLSKLHGAILIGPDLQKQTHQILYRYLPLLKDGMIAAYSKWHLKWN